MENQNLKTKIRIGKVRASYVHVFHPYSMNHDEKDARYSMVLIIPKKDKESIEKVQNAIKAAYSIGLSEKWGGKKPSDDWSPLHDGDVKQSDKPEYVDSYYLNAKNSTKPGIAKPHPTNRYITIDGKKKLNTLEITDEKELYSGCYVYATLGFFAYSYGGKRGISCGLDNVLKVEDGEMLGGRASAESDFGDLDLPEDDDIFGDAPDDMPY